MHANQLVKFLEAYVDAALVIRLPDNTTVPEHFHVTEVGRLQKSFIDCGGTRREHAACLLQAWTANDVEHRIRAGKLAGILKMADTAFNTGALPLEIEYGPEVAAQYALSAVHIEPGRLILSLAGKKTDCLAREQCGLACSTSDCCN